MLKKLFIVMFLLVFAFSPFMSTALKAEADQYINNLLEEMKRHGRGDKPLVMVTLPKEAKAYGFMLFNALDGSSILESCLCSERIGSLTFISDYVGQEPLGRFNRMLWEQNGMSVSTTEEETVRYQRLDDGTWSVCYIKGRTQKEWAASRATYYLQIQEPSNIRWIRNNALSLRLSLTGSTILLYGNGLHKVTLPKVPRVKLFLSENRKTVLYGEPGGPEFKVKVRDKIWNSQHIAIKAIKENGEVKWIIHMGNFYQAKAAKFTSEESLIEFVEEQLVSLYLQDKELQPKSLNRLGEIYVPSETRKSSVFYNPKSGTVRLANGWLNKGEVIPVDDARTFQKEEDGNLWQGHILENLSRYELRNLPE